MTNPKLSSAFDATVNLMEQTVWEGGQVIDRLRRGLQRRPLVVACTLDGQRYPLKNYDRPADTVELEMNGYTVTMKVEDLELHFDMFELFDYENNRELPESVQPIQISGWMRSSTRIRTLGSKRAA